MLQVWVVCFPLKELPGKGRSDQRHLTDRIVTIAQLLKDGGYQTFMAGKWHLGSEDAFIPYAKGFEKSFALMNGGANHFNNSQIFFNEPPKYRSDSSTVFTRMASSRLMSIPIK